uniref:Uncharacterized protein n=1 Tax=Leptocylindrus danicus TaxID=163516 RepID=A0A7S2KZ15_9STRA|mmetsp:Transcript_28366/g.41740  ORF Transcript_28366/g.41740 Transcript_28366/m.41740 type:complete len:164 (+) Transcript_28366:51-542(+)
MQNQNCRGSFANGCLSLESSKQPTERENNNHPYIFVVYKPTNTYLIIGTTTFQSEIRKIISIVFYVSLRLKSLLVLTQFDLCLPTSCKQIWRSLEKRSLSSVVQQSICSPGTLRSHEVRFTFFSPHLILLLPLVNQQFLASFYLRLPRHQEMLQVPLVKISMK